MIARALASSFIETTPHQGVFEYGKTVIICGKLFDGLGDTTLGPTEILIEGDTIVEVSNSVGRPDGAHVLDLSDCTVSPGFIDTHVHLCVDGLNLARQTLQCSPAKALPRLEILPRIVRSFVEICLGTSPSQAPKSRPLENTSLVPIAATMALEMIGPIPGTVIRRELA